MDYSGANNYDLSVFGLAPGQKESCDRVVWANNFVNCPVQMTMQPNDCPHINPLPDRYKIASLDPLIQYYSQLHGQIANPYEKKYFYGRTSLAQMQWNDIKNSSNNNRSKERYQRHISRPEDAFCVQQKLADGKVPAFVKL